MYSSRTSGDSSSSRILTAQGAAPAATATVALSTHFSDSTPCRSAMLISVTTKATRFGLRRDGSRLSGRPERSRL